MPAQRYWCLRCRSSYSGQSALLVWGWWYAREIYRFALGRTQHVGSSARRLAELVRSLVGRPERQRLACHGDRAEVAK